MVESTDKGMANAASASAIPETINLPRTILDPIEHGIAASLRRALAIGVPTHMVIECALNNLASVVATVTPPGARLATIEAVVEQFADLVSRHVLAQATTAGGIIRAKSLADLKS